PHVELVHRRVEPFEADPAVAALVDAVIGAGEERARLARVDGQPEHAAFAPQPLHHPPPALATVGAQPRAAADRPDADRIILRHRVLLSPWTAAVSAAIASKRQAGGPPAARC